MSVYFEGRMRGLVGNNRCRNANKRKRVPEEKVARESFVVKIKNVWIFFKKPLTFPPLRAIISKSSKDVSGCGAVGSALPWGGRGRTFKSCHSDQIKSKTNRFRLYFLHFQDKIKRFSTTFAPPEIPKIF